jgi:outer membrane receptor protein involved in Fe transport
MFAQAPAAEVPNLEMLLFSEIPAVLTKTDKDKAPASVTTITADQIRMTPARNIYDLLEAYVPGAFWIDHHEGPHVGMRGIMSDRNYKLILLLNGRRVNQDAHSGGVLELENWDMNDIERIEIVRGPGSVTYGPGAVEGVINIVTKNATTAPGLQAGMQYAYPYDSKGANVSYGWNGEQLKLFAYGSAYRTSGLIPNEFFVDANNHTGILGKDAGLTNQKSEYYFNDADNRPQLKCDLEADWMDEWQAFAHYSNEGTSEHAFAPQTIFPDGTYENVKVNWDQGVLAMIRHQRKWLPELQVKSMLSFSSQDHTRRQFSVSGGGSEDIDSIKNICQKFSETEVLANVIANYTLAEKYQFAFGGEYSDKWFGPGWGDGVDRLRMGDSSNIFGSQQEAIDSGAAAPYYIANNGWKAFTASLLGEANLEFDPHLNLIASGRLDRHEFISTPYFSPRVGLVSDFDQIGLFKLTWQQSVRMNTEEQMFMYHVTSGDNALEKLNGWEFMYNVKPVQNLTINTSFYYNTLWSTLGVSSSGFSFGQSTLLGTLRLWGAELEGLYTAGALTLGANQSYCKQIDFHLAAGQKNTGISYSDYNYSVSGEHLGSTGDDLNNWYNWASKLWAEYKITPEHTLHLDAHVFWGYQGAEDGLDMLVNGAQGTANQASVDPAVQAVRDAGGFAPDIRLNASYRYEFLKNTALTLFGMNLVNFTNNKRYSYDSGALKSGPAKVSWIDEPLTVGAKIDYKY